MRTGLYACRATDDVEFFVGSESPFCSSPFQFERSLENYSVENRRKSIWLRMCVCADKRMTALSMSFVASQPVIAESHASRFSTEEFNGGKLYRIKTCQRH